MAFRLKFNPFANVSREAIEAIYTLRNCRRIRLAASGYLSVGCMPCTKPEPRRMKMRGRAVGAAEPRQNAASIRSRLHRTMTLQHREQ